MKLSRGFIPLMFFILFVETVHASDISYTAIVGTSRDSVSVVISSIVEKVSYDCSTISFDCVQTKKQVDKIIDNPIKEVTLDWLDERDKNITSTTIINSLIKEKPDYGPFVVPDRAVFITYSPNQKMLAYYVSDNGPLKTYKSYYLLFDDGQSLQKSESASSWELVTDTPRLFAFTDDSNGLVYLDDRDGSSRLYFVNLSKKPINLAGEALIKKSYTVLDFIVHGNIIYFIANRKGPYNWGLYGLDLDTRKLTTIHDDVMYTNDLVFVEDKLLFTENDNGTGRLKSYLVKEKKIKNFTGIAQGTVNSLQYNIVSTKNIKGVLLSPPKNSNLKALIWLHGGPYRQTSLTRHSYGSYATYDWMLDEMVSSGVTVLKLDYPGSMGYGLPYTTSLVGNIGKVDVQNVSKAIDFLKQKGIKEVYLFGNSYGGYLAVKSLVELNSKLSGATAVAPVTDWEKLINYSHPTPFEVHFGGVLNMKNKKLYDKSSIVENLQKLTKPLTLFHGELDKQVPFRESEYLFRQAKSLNKDVKYYSVTNQGHIINGVAQNEAICSKVAQMMDLVPATDLCVMH